MTDVPERYQPIVDYIEAYWDKCLLPPKANVWGSPRNLVMHLGRVKLPHAFAAPNDRYFAGTQFYWDTYFTIIGLVVSGHAKLARDMVDNLCYLFRRFGLIPARNSLTSIGRTQPPFLTRMAYEVYEAGGADRKWLNKVMKVARKEYERVWMGALRTEGATGLNWYQPKYLKRFLAVYESGWDISSRYKNGHQHVVPVDLNCLLYQYEKDFLQWSKEQGDEEAVRRWKSALAKRRGLINQFFWDESEGFYFDYNRQKFAREDFRSLAGYFPLWCGVASRDQARRCAERLGLFERIGGLAASEKTPLYHRQWDYPNGWAPLIWITYMGLQRYGLSEDAERIADKWLEANLTVFERTGKLWEKYDVEKIKAGKPGRYPTQSGFAWTNGVFLRLLQEKR